MKKINLLEQFYNEKVFIKNTKMKQFNELDEWQKDSMRDTFVFDMYKFKNAMSIIKKEFNLTLLIVWTIIFSVSIAFAYVFVIGLLTLLK
ncbi:MAG: hypothetical protein QQN55_01190 [Nitrosopumilus sp.]